jgi:peptide chain release factor 1
MTLRFAGPGVWKAFENEPGKHVVQRVPPTERNGRRHTSVVSVAVLPILSGYPSIPENEIEIITQRGHGPGGQNQNKVESAVRARHKPTGLHVFINGRDQGQNKKEAIRILSAKVQEFYCQKKENVESVERVRQMGGGGRSGKVRTYNFLDSRVTDHRLGKKTNQIEKIMKGNFNLLFD